ncbi:hypothetical protein, partial [Bacteroides heparinolyticus]|uniref:hypothetical protein n=1 Tax=Prevotella heparinolytica TaxID=28113 RepID=UPI0035A15EDC
RIYIAATSFREIKQVLDVKKEDYILPASCITTSPLLHPQENTFSIHTPHFRGVKIRKQHLSHKIPLFFRGIFRKNIYFCANNP